MEMGEDKNSPIVFMAIVKLTKDFPVWIKSELDSSPSDDAICCILTSREVTILRSALFPVVNWRTRFGERVGNRFEYIDDEAEILNFKLEIDQLDYKLSGGYMADCLEALIATIEAQTAVLQGLRLSCGNVTTGGCGCGGSTEGKIIQPAPEDITEESPPEGMIPAVEITPDLRCRHINYLIDNIGAAIHDLNINGAGSSISGGVQWTITILFALATKNPLIAYNVYKIIGYIETLAALMNQYVDLSHMDTVYNEEGTREDLVCAWYNCPEYDTLCAYTALSSVLSAAGMNTAEIAVVAGIASTVGISSIWYDEMDYYPIYDDMNAYEGGIDCSTQCHDWGVFDFENGELGWQISEEESTNGNYDELNHYFNGYTAGTGNAMLTIFYPGEEVSITNLKIWILGTLAQVDQLAILTADDLEGTWINVAEMTNQSTPGEDEGFTMLEFTNLTIVDKYIKIYARRFWTGANVSIKKIIWE
jgi:hypothetical protein